MNGFNGLGMNLGNLSRLSGAKTRSISAENPTGGKGAGAMAEADPKGAARELGRGWKCRPCIDIPPGATETVADIEGPGAVQSIWMTGAVTRDMILRVWWDGQAQPSVECPLPDFFGGHFLPLAGKQPVQLSSLPVCVNPRSGLNCFWEMPFRRRCRVAVENLNPREAGTLFYQINYTLTAVPDDAAYFHAQFRRTNPLPYLRDYVLLDGVRGRGQYVGTSMGWSIHNDRWWGEGEIKFFMDGDGEYPTICGTGTEDYFLGSYDWDVNGRYAPYNSPYAGMFQVVVPDGLYAAVHRHAMYRWHIMDPVRFDSELRVTIQSLGWRSEGRFLPGMHDICSTAYWYQTLPTAPFPAFPDRNALELI